MEGLDVGLLTPLGPGSPSSLGGVSVRAGGGPFPDVRR